jgi:hypothetical protein
VERVFSINNPDPLEVEKAKKVLKVKHNFCAYYLSLSFSSNTQCLQEQEQSLIDAIARLAEASDGESGKY